MPLPPTNLRGQLAASMSAVTLMWQPPLALIIDKDIVYTINLNLSILNFTHYDQDMTSNLTYTYQFEAQCDTLHLTVSVFAQNMVGRGQQIQEELMLDIPCTTNGIL